MKMPEKHDPLAILAAINTASGQSLRLQWRTFAADIMAVRLQNSNLTCNDARRHRSVHS